MFDKIIILILVLSQLALTQNFLWDIVYPFMHVRHTYFGSMVGAW